jgi:raffinose/stachyose/melibiose transport system permease protein
MDGFQKTKTIVSRFLVNLLVSLLSLSGISQVVSGCVLSLKTQMEFALNIVSLPSIRKFAPTIQDWVEGNLGVAFRTACVHHCLVVFASLGIIIGSLLSRFSIPGRSFGLHVFLAGMLSRLAVDYQSFWN